MAQDHSFDVVSKVNLQELRNAVQQAQKEIATRFDFRGSRTSVMFEESSSMIKVEADDRAQLRSVVEVFEGKLAKRGVSPAAFAWRDPEQLPSGGMKRQAQVQQGLSPERAKQITKVIKELELKVQARIEGDAVRVSGKQLDELQAVVRAIRGTAFGVPVQVENYR